MMNTPQIVDRRLVALVNLGFVHYNRNGWVLETPVASGASSELGSYSVEEPLKHLMQELGNAINDSLSESDRIAEAIGEIKKAGLRRLLGLGSHHRV